MDKPHVMGNITISKGDGIPMTKVYDLLEYIGMAKEMATPSLLYNFYDRVCAMYDRKEISSYFLDEVSAAVHPHMKALEALERELNESDK